MIKVLLVQTTIEPPGGGNTVAVWIIEALKKDYSVSLLTWKPPDLEEINRFYGTSLSSSEFTVHYINPIIRSIINLDPDPGSFQKFSYLMRVCKGLKRNYDVLISINNEVDFGCKGIQYFHCPYMHKKMRPVMDLPWYKKSVGVFNGNYRPWMMLSGFSYSRMKNNLTLVNSDWTGAKVKEFYGIEPMTVYPPIPGDFPDIPWEEKENGFVCVGRFHPDKRFESIIEILTRVKMNTIGLHLHIIGTLDLHPEGYYYHKRIKALVEANSSWVCLHENPSRKALMELVAKHRYGIHANQEEHFGIAVAEMVKADCIVFVPNNGGQVEIVGEDKRLVYRNEEEAAEKIIQVMSNPDEQTFLRNYLNSRKELFSTEKFASSIHEIVRGFLEVISKPPDIST